MVVQYLEYGWPVAKRRCALRRDSCPTTGCQLPCLTDAFRSFEYLVLDVGEFILGTIAHAVSECLVYTADILAQPEWYPFNSSSLILSSVWSTTYRVESALVV